MKKQPAYDISFMEVESPEGEITLGIRYKNEGNIVFQFAMKKHCALRYMACLQKGIAEVWPEVKENV